MKRNIMSVLSVIILMLCASCDDMGGNTEPFTTVEVFATFEDSPYNSDAVVKEDTSDPADDICDTDTYEDDTVTITVTSTAIESLSEDVVSSDVKIMGYTVEYTAREDDSPDLPSKSFEHEIVVEPDTATEIPVRVVDIEDKAAGSGHPLDYRVYWNTGAIQYEYTVSVRFRVEEVSSGRDETVIVDFPLYYFDIADECAFPGNWDP